MFGFTGLLQSLIDCILQFSKYSQVKIENQQTTDIIEDKKDLKKAGNISEQIIEIALKYKSSMSKKDQRKLKSLVKKFNKVD